MTAERATYDVFLAYDARDVDIAHQVAESLRAHGLGVFDSTRGLSPGTALEAVVWDAMAGSHALVVVIPSDAGSSWLAFEIGAAKAWNKPIYAVSSVSTHEALPAPLRNLQILPLSRIDEIAQSIGSTHDPLSEQEVHVLGEAFLATGLTTDQLLVRPRSLAKLVDQFNRKTGRLFAGEQLMWHLLRLRKQSRLPSLGRRRRPKG